MHAIQIDASPKQLSKLRRGMPVRVKKGTGFNLIVSPDKFHLMSRTFGRDKGIEISLSPDEIQANQEVAPEMEGKGIFGKKFDRLLKKAGIKKLAYQVGDTIKPAVKAAILGGLSAGGAALGATETFATGGAGAPFAAMIPAGVIGLSGLANDYLDNPSKYQGKSGLKGKQVASMAGQIAKAKAEEMVNKELGTNFGYMGRAGIESALQNAGNEALSTIQGQTRRLVEPIPDYADAFGEPMSVGHGLRHRIRTIHERGSIGRGASMIQSKYIMPPALQSQPHGANFQMRHFLPPQYQSYFDPMLDHSFNSSIGSGLYAGGQGHGLYSGGGLY